MKFAKDVRIFCNELTKSATVNEDSKQLVRSSGSIGANYIEANESLSKKDFIMRLKISRKEARESRYWLELLESNSQSSADPSKLIREATELIKIFSAIITSSEK